jgi:hypothetical protein
MRVITPEAVLSYPHLFTPQAAEDGGTPKYSCALVFPEGTDLSALKQAVVSVLADKFGEKKAAELIQKKQIRLPFRDGAEKNYPEGSVFINVRGAQAPGVVSTIPDPNTGRPMSITDEEEIYPGCIVRASISAFYYDTSGNKGVSFGLNNVQKIRDGKRLDSRVRAEDEFEADASAVASLDDLTDDSAQEDEAPKARSKKGGAVDLAALLT